ncbi:uncharacterized protein LOC131662921 [Phymastichus coffea]|nr:uncharacterized protein LOC131662921 [Phymastichus coffea]
MFSRNFFIFSAILLVVALASASAQSDEIEFESSLEIVERSKFGRKVEKILKKFFKNITEVCLKQAVSKCKKHWYNPAKVIKCAQDFFNIENIGCLVGA